MIGGPSPGGIPERVSFASDRLQGRTVLDADVRSAMRAATIGGARTLDPALVLSVLGLVGLVCLAAGFPGLRLPIGLALLALVAYANGANDISKAIATLVGSGVADVRMATAWGTAATGLGASISVITGAALLAAFSTRLLPEGVGIGLPFALGAMVGTAGGS
jgi:hypothetical protein